MSLEGSDPDKIARCVIDAYDKLPSKFKPRKLADGRREWVPLAGIVLSYRKCLDPESHDDESPPSGGDAGQYDTLEEFSNSAPSEKMISTCVALATGMKCLPQSRLVSARGAVLHDSHAEILALRAFNRFLLDECLALATQQVPNTDLGGLERKEFGSAWVRWRGDVNPGGAAAAAAVAHGDVDHCPPFELKPGIKIYMFCSELPCGDASMEMIMAEQDDATPWSTSATGVAEAATTTVNHSELGLERNGCEDEGEAFLLGRGHFDRLGIVRRKPSRPDAPLTLSKSCSDKLALKQCTSLLSGVMNLGVEPRSCYLDTLIVPERGFVAEGFERAFSRKGRMGSLMPGEDWESRELGFRGFEVKTTGVEFEAGRMTKGEGAVPSNLSAVWTVRRREVLINGVLQGRKQTDLKGASCLSRRKMWEDMVVLVSLAGAQEVRMEVGDGKSYGDLKSCRMLKAREEVKAVVRSTALKGWKKNLGDVAWRLNSKD